jgi:tRNA uridine 5-carboxymethylaminomethyl modification enzyme
MWIFPDSYDIIVVGGGHAGCEAALAGARAGCKTLLLTMNLDTIAKMSCNPAIGGVAKGHMVREIDALGGEMAKVIDKTGIQFRMLNASKGPAVWAPRAQADKVAYQFEMKHRLELCEGLDIHQGTIESLIIENQKIKGVRTKEGVAYSSKAVIISSGTFMMGKMHIGENNMQGGRAGDLPSVGLSKCLEDLGFNLERLKTGTPPRIHKQSIDFSNLEEQPGEEGISFSNFPEEGTKRLPQISCYITYTTDKTKDIVSSNVNRSAMYSGKIEGVGPRYCPSIEDKVVRFADKDRHQIFLEPEGLQTEEVYVNGVSSSLPFDVQIDFIRSITGLEKAHITRPAYAIEYDYVTCGQVNATLETRLIESLYLAGQINGTSGYEEAAAQGLMAAINAAAKIQGKEAFILKRSEAYIGVMIDDLVTKELDEPYRMFTSRAEHRLILRQDNADQRLCHYGKKYGLLDDKNYQHFLHKQDKIQSEIERLQKVHKQVRGKGAHLGQLLSRPENNYKKLLEDYPEDIFDYGEDINFQIEIYFKYAGYIKRQTEEIKKLSNLENIKLDPSFDYKGVKGLRNEAQEKLDKIRPINLGQASRISGVSPADISVLMIRLRQGQKSPKLMKP